MPRTAPDTQSIRPRFDLEEAIEFRDLMKKIVVQGLMSGDLSVEERNSIALFELKLTELIIRAETRLAIRELKSS